MKPVTQKLEQSPKSGAISRTRRASDTEIHPQILLTSNKRNARQVAGISLRQKNNHQPQVRPAFCSSSQVFSGAK